MDLPVAATRTQEDIARSSRSLQSLRDLRILVWKNPYVSRFSGSSPSSHVLLRNTLASTFGSPASSAQACPADVLMALAAALEEPSAANAAVPAERGLDVFAQAADV